DRAEAARDVARVGLEVVHLVVDAGPVEHALLLGPGAVRERAVHRRRLARAGAEDPGDVVGQPVGVARAARRPTLAALAAVVLGLRPPPAAREVEPLAALDRRLDRIGRGGRRLERLRHRLDAEVHEREPARHPAVHVGAAELLRYHEADRLLARAD